MSPSVQMSGDALSVYRQFMKNANAQYRAAGMSDMQIHVDKKGNAKRAAGWRQAATKRIASVGKASADQARAKAGISQAQQGAAQGTQRSAPTGSKSRAGASPVIADLVPIGTDKFKLVWQPVAGAQAYGIWQNGKLVGHVPNPSFAAQVTQGTPLTIRIDAVMPNGQRTQKTRPLQVGHGDKGLAFNVPGASQGPSATQQAQQGAAQTAPQPTAAAPASS